MRGEIPLPDIGQLRDRVDLQTRADTAASDGGTTEAYTTVATVWARVVAVSGSLYFAGQQVETTVTHAVTIRGRGDVAGVDHLRWSGRRLRVQRVRDLDTSAPVTRFQEFLCEEIRSGA